MTTTQAIPPAVSSGDIERRPWGARFGPLTRLLMSAGLTVLGIAMAMGAAFGVSAANGVATVKAGSGVIYRVSPGGPLVAVCSVLAAAALAVALFVVWRARWSIGAEHADDGIRPLGRLVRIGVGATAVVFLSVMLAGANNRALPLIPGDRQYLFGVVFFVALGVVCFVWVPVVHRLEVRRFAGVLGAKVMVLCPGCGYDLSGLNTLTCPECGRGYTVDELIRGQREKRVWEGSSGGGAAGKA